MTTTDPDIIVAEIVEEITIEPERTPRQQYIHEMRQLLDLLEEDPTIPMPSEFASYSYLSWYAGDAADAASITKAIGGKWKKNDPNSGSSYDENNMVLKRKLDREVEVRVTVSRGLVCERKVVGTEKKKVQKLVSAAVYEDVYEDVDVVEFECGSLLSAAAQLEKEKLGVTA